MCVRERERIEKTLKSNVFVCMCVRERERGRERTVLKGKVFVLIFV